MKVCRKKALLPFWYKFYSIQINFPCKRDNLILHAAKPKAKPALKPCQDYFFLLICLCHPKIFFVWQNYLNNHFLKSRLQFIVNATHIKEKCVAVENQKINNGILESSGISLLSCKYVVRHLDLSIRVYSSLVWSFRKYCIPENKQYFIITMSHLNFQSHWSVITVRMWDRNHFQFCKVSTYQVRASVLHMGKKNVMSQTLACR